MLAKTTHYTVNRHGLTVKIKIIIMAYWNDRINSTIANFHSNNNNNIIMETESKIHPRIKLWQWNMQIITSCIACISLQRKQISTGNYVAKVCTTWWSHRMFLNPVYSSAESRKRSMVAAKEAETQYHSRKVGYSLSLSLSLSLFLFPLSVSITVKHIFFPATIKLISNLCRLCRL